MTTQSGSRDSRTGGRRPPRGKYIPKRKICFFCRDKVKVIDYKDPVKLRPYISERGKISPRRKIGTCARHQRALTTSIKRARHLALLPFVAAHTRKAPGVMQ
jgi:small subunit ribosomal protein S18